MVSLVHTPVVWLGEASGGLEGGVVSVTTIDWFAVVTAPWLSVAVHWTVVEPSGSVEGRLFVSPDRAVGVGRRGVAHAGVAGVAVGGVALEDAVDDGDHRRRVGDHTASHLEDVAPELAAGVEESSGSARSPGRGVRQRAGTGLRGPRSGSSEPVLPAPSHAALSVEAAVAMSHVIWS